MSAHKFKLNDQTLWLSPERVIFWEEEKALILSDLHFGKTGHFRKSGIGLPQDIFKEDLQRLFALIQFFKPSRLLIVGDMFHSHHNKELELFAKWRKDIRSLSVSLIKGNHDILEKKFYADANIDVSDHQLLMKDFCFTHDIEGSCKDKDHIKKYFTFSGHLHPGLRINGYAKQSLRFPCFYFSKKYAVLPAFSRFTGLTSMEVSKGDKAFVIVDGEIIEAR